MFFRFNRIRNQLSLAFLAVILVLTLVFSVLVYFHQKETVYNQTINQLSTVSRLKTNAIEQWLREEKWLVELLASEPFINHHAIKLLNTREGSPEYRGSFNTLYTYLKSIPLSMKDINRVSILSNVGGREVISSDKSTIGQYHLTDSFFTRGAKKTYVQKIYYSKSKDEPSMIVATPLRDNNGEQVGVLYVVLDPTFITNLMKETSGLGETGETFLVDIRRQIVTPHQTAKFKGKQISTLAIDKGLQHQSGKIITKNHKGKTVLSVYQWIEEPRAVLLTEIELREIYEPLHDFILLLIFISIAIITSSFVVAKIFSNHLTKPIINLTTVAEKISMGDLNQKAAVTTNNEIGVLSRVFNEMTDSLTTTLSEKDLALTALEETNVELHEANRAKTTFLANMSHELRTPLNAVIGFSQVMQAQKENLPNDEWVEYVSSINTAGNHLLALISDLLDFSSTEHGKLELNEIEFEIHDMIKDVLRIIQPLVKSRHNELIVNISESIGIMVADITRIKQIILNLVGNAEKFTENGTVSLGVDSSQDGETEYIVFTVTDTGIGIPPEHLNMIFDTFTQVDPSTTRKYGGTGLGLAISKRFSEAMGGSIDVESKEGVGSTFTVKIPRYIVKPALMVNRQDNAS